MKDSPAQREREEVVMDARFLLQPVLLGSEPPLDLQDWIQTGPTVRASSSSPVSNQNRFPQPVLNGGRQKRPVVMSKGQLLQRLRVGTNRKSACVLGQAALFVWQLAHLLSLELGGVAPAHAHACRLCKHGL